MKRTIPFFLIIFFASGVFADPGTVTVNVLSSEQGTGLTEIEYEFTGDNDVYNISVEVSFDNGTSFDPIPVAHLEGAFTNVAPGGPYFLTWHGGASFPDTFSKETVIKIDANTATFNCGETLTFTYRGSEVTYGSVLSDYSSNPAPHNIGTRCWLDRNLGASQVAMASDDHLAYGDLFQWGRGDDGHQDRTSGTTSTLSGSDTPGHGDFITINHTPWDWRSPQNDDLWQGVNGINNPCPPGWRVPTKTELDAERESWTEGDNSAGAYASSLKLPVGGSRSITGSLVGTVGQYWSSTTADSYPSRYLHFHSSTADITVGNRAQGFSVRCIKDDNNGSVSTR